MRDDVEVEIPEPCSADWEAMEARDRGRFCLDCQTRVHDLSAMTEAEAQRFLTRNADRDDICLSFLHTEDGTIQYQAAQPRLVPLKRLLRLAPAAGLAAAVAACTPIAPDSDQAEPAKVEAPEAAPEAAAPDSALLRVEHEPSRQRSILANPADALPPPPPRVDPDEPCDGGASTQPAEPTASEPPPPVIRRLGGKPMIRKKGKRKRHGT